MDPVLVKIQATRENYYEVGYLAANPDVAQAVAAGGTISGKQHFEEYTRCQLIRGFGTNYTILLSVSLSYQTRY
jgi:hypothetical protein